MRSAVLAGLVLLAGCEASKQENVAENLAAEPGTTASESAAAATATPGPPIVGPAEKRFQALGTEPFWSIEVFGGKLLYTSPEQQSAVTIEARLTAIGKQGDGGLVWEGQMDGQPVSLTIRKGQCSDGMSDTVYSYTALLTWGERTEQGCARLK